MEYRRFSDYYGNLLEQWGGSEIICVERKWTYSKNIKEEKIRSKEEFVIGLGERQVFRPVLFKVRPECSQAYMKLSKEYLGTGGFKVISRSSVYMFSFLKLFCLRNHLGSCGFAFPAFILAITLLSDYKRKAHFSPILTWPRCTTPECKTSCQAKGHFQYWRSVLKQWLTFMPGEYILS